MNHLTLFGVLFLLFLISEREVAGRKKKSLNLHGRMINGVKAKRRNWQFIAYISFHQPSPPWKTCGGALIGEQFVLTAAHCIEDIADKPQFVTVGVRVMKRRKTFLEGHNVTVSKIIPHPDFILPEKRVNGVEWSFDGDIAILKLSEKIEGNRIPIALPDASEDISSKSDIQCRAAGWGKSTPYANLDEQQGGQYDVEARLAEISVPLHSKRVCLNSLEEDFKPYYGKDLKRMICGGAKNEQGQASCTGDSGSPLVCRGPNGKDLLEGIVLSGADLCKPEGGYLFFGEVAKFRNWIDKVMRENA